MCPRAITVPRAGSGLWLLAQLFGRAETADYPHGVFVYTIGNGTAPVMAPLSLRPLIHVRPALSEGITGLTAVDVIHRNTGVIKTTVPLKASQLFFMSRH